METQHPLKSFLEKNKVALLSVFLMNGVMLWMSWARYSYPQVPKDVQAGLHNMVLLGNFLASLWMCWKMEWKIADYRKMVSPVAPDDAKALPLVLAVLAPLAIGAVPLFLFMPGYIWLETVGVAGAFLPKLASTFICCACFLQILASGWVMNLHNREQFEKEEQHHLLLAMFRSFIDFFFYYMLLACTGLLLSLLFETDQLKNIFVHFKLPDVIFCILAADLMLGKALYELSTKQPFLWSTNAHWSADLPAGMIKVLVVVIFASTLPIPTEAERMAAKQQAAEPQARMPASDAPMPKIGPFGTKQELEAAKIGPFGHDVQDEVRMPASDKEVGPKTKSVRDREFDHR